MITLSASVSILSKAISQLVLRDMSQERLQEETSRKRKFGLNDEDSSGKDSNCSTPPSRKSESAHSLVEPGETGAIGDQLSCPRHKVRIKETDLLPARSCTEQDPGPSTSQHLSGECKCSLDLYGHFFHCLTGCYYLGTGMGMDGGDEISTGDYFTDKVLLKLESQGFTALHEITRGQYGSIVLAQSSHMNKRVALKFLIKNGKRKLRKQASEVITHPWECGINDEIFISDRLKHTNVVEMLEYYCINGRLCLVLEYCEGGNLQQLLAMTPSGLLTEAVTKRYFSQMIDGLEFIHRYDIVHRDVTGRHFIINCHDVIKLCDFGMAKKISPVGGTLFRDRCGSPGHHPPEILEGKPYEPKAVDRWALGVLLYKMVSSKLPFPVESKEALRDMQKGLGFANIGSVHLSEQVKQLLKGLLHYVITVRFSFNRVRQSSWFQEDKSPKLSIGNSHLVRQVPQKHWPK